MDIFYEAAKQGCQERIQAREHDELVNIARESHFVAPSLWQRLAAKLQQFAGTMDVKYDELQNKFIFRYAHR